MDLDFGSDKPPLDEADKSCATTPAPPTTTTTTTQRHLPFDDTYGSIIILLSNLFFLTFVFFQSPFLSPSVLL